MTDSKTHDQSTTQTPDPATMLATLLHKAFNACAKPDAKPLAIAKVAILHPEVTPEMVRTVFHGEHKGTVSSMATAVIKPQVYVDAMSELADAKAATSSKAGDSFFMFSDPPRLRADVVQAIKDGTNLDGKALAKLTLDDAAHATESDYRAGRVIALLTQAGEQLAKLADTATLDVSECEVALAGLRSAFGDVIRDAKAAKPAKEAKPAKAA